MHPGPPDPRDDHVLEWPGRLFREVRRGCGKANFHGGETGQHFQASLDIDALAPRSYRSASVRRRDPMPLRLVNRTRSASEDWTQEVPDEGDRGKG